MKMFLLFSLFPTFGHFVRFIVVGGFLLLILRRWSRMNNWSHTGTFILAGSSNPRNRIRLEIEKNGLGTFRGHIYRADQLSEVLTHEQATAVLISLYDKAAASTEEKVTSHP